MSMCLHAGVNPPKLLICVEQRACLLWLILTLYNWRPGLFTQERKPWSCCSHRLVLHMLFQNNIWNLWFTFPRCLHVAWNFQQCIPSGPFSFHFALNVTFPDSSPSSVNTCSFKSYLTFALGWIFLWVLQFTPTVQRHTGQVNGRILTVHWYEYVSLYVLVWQTGIRSRTFPWLACWDRLSSSSICSRVWADLSHFLY